MTGLNPRTDSILSLSCLLTTASLQLLDPKGFHTTIHHPASTLSAMSPWCLTTHTATGLVSACSASTTSAPTAAAALLAYIESHIPEQGVALLAGNSIHMDRAFLSYEPWDRVLAHLHYRVLDVSSIKEAVRRWAPDRVVGAVPRKVGAHTAEGDVLESLEEVRFYMRLLRGLGEGEQKEDRKEEETG
jgi:oligoribonuclease